MTTKKTTRNNVDYVISIKDKTSFHEKQSCDNEPQEKILYTTAFLKNEVNLSMIIIISDFTKI
jgi:hypothetical protein